MNIHLFIYLFYFTSIFQLTYDHEMTLDTFENQSDIAPKAHVRTIFGMTEKSHDPLHNIIRKTKTHL